MKIATGTVVDGKIILEDVSLDEGSSVTVLANDEGGLELTPEQERDLLMSMAEADRGDAIPAE